MKKISEPTLKHLRDVVRDLAAISKQAEDALVAGDLEKAITRRREYDVLWDQIEAGDLENVDKITKAFLQKQ
jgi:hypothetical protein